MSGGSAEATPQLPPVYELPANAIERWSGLPGGVDMVVPISKETLDQLMLGLRRMAFSQMTLGDAFAAHTRGEMDVANDLFIKHQTNVRDSYSNLNRFIEAVMLNAGPSAGGESG